MPYLELLLSDIAEVRNIEVNQEMNKWFVKKKRFAATVLAAGLIGALTATAVAQSQRFPDVPPDHYAHEAVEWAAEVGVTTGYTDGTFRPERPLIKRHAVVFMERYYDEILQAEESEDFTRGDMMVLLKAINDGIIRDGETELAPDPPAHSIYEAAVTAASAWYDQMEAIIGDGVRVADWEEVILQAAEKSDLWAGHDLIADRIANEALLMSRTGDPIISDQLSDIWEARFYLGAIAYRLAVGASVAAQADGASESDAASAAAWSAAGARLAELAQGTRNWIRCTGCVIGGYDRFDGSYRGAFDWKTLALAKAGEARNAYFELATWPTPDPDPPAHSIYEAAVTAASAWYDQMEAIIGGGVRVADWEEVILQAAEKSALWAGHDLIADRIANEALLMSRTGDPIISDQLSDMWEARFYLGAIAHRLAVGASAAAQADGASESDAASAAAWSAAGARLAELAQGTRNWIRCTGCVIGGYDRFDGSYRGAFDWKNLALAKAGEARNAYFELAS